MLEKFKKLMAALKKASLMYVTTYKGDVYFSVKQEGPELENLLRLGREAGFNWDTRQDLEEDMPKLKFEWAERDLATNFGIYKHTGPLE